jgi:hypothetical protein
MHAARAHGDRHKQRTDPLQAVAAHVPVGRQLQRMHDEENAREQLVAEPVGQHAHRDDAGDHAVPQTQARIQPITKAHAADDGADAQVEGVADEIHRHHRRRRQAVAGVAPPDQVEAAVKQVAERRETDGDRERRCGNLGDRVPHLLPVEVARVVDQQVQHRREEGDGEDALGPLPQLPGAPMLRVTGRVLCAARPGPCERAAGQGAAVHGYFLPPFS